MEVISGEVSPLVGSRAMALSPVSAVNCDVVA